MTGIILVGHGNFATGLSSAANLIFGELEKFEALDFTIDTTPEILERKIEEKIKEFDNNDSPNPYQGGLSKTNKMKTTD